MLGTTSPFPLSLDNIRKFTGKGPRYDFFAMMASRDISMTCYDFKVKALDTTNVWTVGATSTATTWAVRAESGGWLRGVTGASLATAALQLSLPTKYWSGTPGCGFASLIRLSSPVGARVEQGFADVLPAVGTTALNSLTTPTFNSVAAGAVYVYDDGTASTAVTGLYTIGTSVAAAKVATTTNRYDSAATLFVAVEIQGTTAKCWVGDGDQPLAIAHTAVAAADAFIPFIAVKKVAGASINVDIDTIWEWNLGRI